jgi:hypothetical protein
VDCGLERSSSRMSNLGFGSASDDVHFFCGYEIIYLFPKLDLLSLLKTCDGEDV